MRNSHAVAGRPDSAKDVSAFHFLTLSNAGLLHMAIAGPSQRGLIDLVLDDYAIAAHLVSRQDFDDCAASGSDHRIAP